MTIIQQLRQLRINQGVTHAKLAQMSGYYPGDIARWERGVYEARGRTLSDLAQALGYDLVLRPR